MKKQRITEGAILLSLLCMIGCSNSEVGEFRRTEDMVGGANYAIGKDHKDNVVGKEVSGLKDAKMDKPDEEQFDIGNGYGSENYTIQIIPESVETTINSIVDFKVKVTEKKDDKDVNVTNKAVRVIVGLKSADGAIGQLSTDTSNIVKNSQSTSQQLVLDVKNGIASVQLHVGNAYSNVNPVYFINVWAKKIEDAVNIPIYVRSTICDDNTCSEGNPDTQNEIHIPDGAKDDKNKPVADAKMLLLDSPNQNLFVNTTGKLRVKLVGGDCVTQNGSGCNVLDGKTICYEFIKGSDENDAEIIVDSNGNTPDPKVKPLGGCGTTDDKGVYSVTLKTNTKYNALYYLNFYHGTYVQESYTIKTQRLAETIGDNGNIAVPMDETGKPAEGLKVPDTSNAEDWGKVLKNDETFSECYDGAGNFICCVIPNGNGTYMVCKDGECTIDKKTCENPVRTDEGDVANVVISKDEEGADYYVGIDTDGDGKPDIAPDPCSYYKVCVGPYDYTILCASDEAGNDAAPCKKYVGKINSDIDVYIKVVNKDNNPVKDLDVQAILARGYYESNNAYLAGAKSLDYPVDSGKTNEYGVVVGNKDSKKFVIKTGTGYDAVYFMKVSTDKARDVNIPISILNTLPVTGTEGDSPDVTDKDGNEKPPVIKPPETMQDNDPVVDEDATILITAYPKDAEVNLTAPIMKTLNLRVQVVEDGTDEPKPIAKATTTWKVTRGESLANNAWISAETKKADDEGVVLNQFYTGTGYNSKYYVTVFHPNYKNGKEGFSFVITTTNETGTEPDAKPEEEAPDVIRPKDKDGNLCCTLQKDKYGNVKSPFKCVECEEPTAEGDTCEVDDPKTKEKVTYALCAPSEPGEVDLTEKDENGVCCTKKKDKYNNIILPVECIECKITCDENNSKKCTCDVIDKETNKKTTYSACADIATLPDADPSIGHEEIIGPNGNVCCNKKKDPHGNIILTTDPETGSLHLECDCDLRDKEAGTCKKTGDETTYDICEYPIEKDKEGNVCCTLTEDKTGCEECKGEVSCEITADRGYVSYKMCVTVTDKDGNECCEKARDSHGNLTIPISCTSDYDKSDTVIDEKSGEEKIIYKKKGDKDEIEYSLCDAGIVVTPTTFDDEGNTCCEKKRDKFGNITYPVECEDDYTEIKDEDGKGTNNYNYKCNVDKKDDKVCKSAAEKEKESIIYGLCAENAELPITPEDREDLEDATPKDDDGNPCCTKVKDAYGNPVHPVQCQECAEKLSEDTKTCKDDSEPANIYAVCANVITPQDQDVPTVDTDADGNKCCKKDRDEHGNVKYPVSCEADGCKDNGDKKTCTKDGEVYGLCANIATAEDSAYEGTSSTDEEGNDCCTKELDSNGNPKHPITCQECTDKNLKEGTKTCTDKDGKVYGVCSNIVTPQEMQELIDKCSKPENADNPSCYQLLISSDNPMTTSVATTVKVKARLIRLGQNKPVEGAVVGWSRDTRSGADGEIRSTSVTVLGTELTGGFTNEKGENTVDFYTGSKDTTYKLKAMTPIINKKDITKSTVLSAIATINVLPHSTTGVPGKPTGLVYLTATDSSDSSTIEYRLASAEYYPCNIMYGYLDTKCGSLAKHHASQSYNQGCSKDVDTGEEAVDTSKASDEKNARRIIAADITDNLMIYAVGKSGGKPSSFACIDSSSFKNYICHNTAGIACSYKVYNRTDCHPNSGSEKLKTYFCEASDGACKWNESCKEKTGVKETDDAIKEDIGENVCEVRDCGLAVIDKELALEPLPPTISLDPYFTNMKVDLGALIGNPDGMNCGKGGSESGSIPCTVKLIRDKYDEMVSGKGEAVAKHIAQELTKTLMDSSKCGETICGSTNMAEVCKVDGKIRYESCKCACGQVHYWASNCKSNFNDPDGWDNDDCTCSSEQTCMQKQADSRDSRKGKIETDIKKKIKSYMASKVTTNYCKLLNGIQLVTIKGETTFTQPYPPMSVAYLGKTDVKSVDVEGGKFVDNVEKLVARWSKGDFDVESRQLTMGGYGLTLASGKTTYGELVYDKIVELIPDELKDKTACSTCYDKDGELVQVDIRALVNCEKIFEGGYTIGSAKISQADIVKLCNSALHSYPGEWVIDISKVKATGLTMKLDSTMQFSVPKGAKCNNAMFGAPRCYRQFNQSDMSGTGSLGGKSAQIKGRWVGRTFDGYENVSLSASSLCKQ